MTLAVDHPDDTATGLNEDARREGMRETNATRDIEFVARLIENDSEAWGNLVDNFGRLIAARASTTLKEQGHNGGGPLLEDCCAEVITSLLDNNMSALRRFAGRSKFSTWLAVVARRVTIRYCQQRSRQQPAIHGDSKFDMATVTPKLSGEDTDLRRIRNARKHLSPSDQKILTLFFDESRSYQQIARDLNISINSVGPKLARAQNRLRQLIRKADTDINTIIRPEGDSK